MVRTVKKPKKGAVLYLRCVYLPKKLDDQLRVLAFAKRTTKNDLIRQYVHDGLKNLDHKRAVNR